MFLSASTPSLRSLEASLQAYLDAGDFSTPFGPDKIVEVRDSRGALAAAAAAAGASSSSSSSSSSGSSSGDLTLVDASTFRVSDCLMDADEFA